MLFHKKFINIYSLNFFGYLVKLKKARTRAFTLILAVFYFLVSLTLEPFFKDSLQMPFSIFPMASFSPYIS